MTQISRPLQVALAAAALAAAVYFVALRGHSAGGESQSAPPAPASAPAPAASSAHGASGAAKQAAARHASSPSVAGLSRTIEKAQGTVKANEHSSAGKPASKQASKPANTVSTPAKPVASKPASTLAKPASKPAKPAATPTSKPTAKPDALAKQKLVEGELKHGQTVIVMFWSPHAPVDAVVHGQLVGLQSLLKRDTRALAWQRDVAVHYSTAAEIGEYGAITRSQQVLQTPTLLVIGPSGKAKTLTGLVDAYAIAQAIDEAHKG